MIVVTGTERSGTSMWMQILIAAGFTPVGEEFPRDWGDSLRDANRGGFWESTLRDGINYHTNPNPVTGMYIRPDQVTDHVVKVFIRGLVRSDIAYLGRVIATARHWRDHAASIRRLWALEDERPGSISRPRLEPVAHWFCQNFLLLGDMTLKGYPAKLCAYEDVLERPRETLEPILAWIGRGDLDAAVEAIRPELERGASEGEGVEHEHADACDVLYRALRTGEPPDTAGRQAMAKAYAAILPQITAHEDALDQFRAARRRATAKPGSPR